MEFYIHDYSFNARDLGHPFYFSKNEYLKVLKYLGLTISKYTGDYYISTENGAETIELSSVYLKRADVYHILGDDDLMCEDLDNARRLGADIESKMCDFNH